MRDQEEEEGEEIEGENKDKNCIFYKGKKLNLSRKLMIMTILELV